MRTLLIVAVLAASSSVFAANLASDNASDSAYSSGWANGSNGGTGFGAWELQTSLQPDGAAGFFTAGTGNTDLNNIDTSDKAWGMYANEAGSGGNDVQIAGAVRPLTGGSLAVGQSIVVSMEHGGIQSGSLTANNPPRTGGWVGFTFNPFGGLLPDPISPLTAINGIFGFGFQGGASEYLIYDVTAPSGRSSGGIPFTDGGLVATFTLTSSTTYSLQVVTLGVGGQTYNLSGDITGSIDTIGLFNRNAEQNDVFFNSLAVVPEPGTLALGALALGVVALRRLRRNAS